MFWITKNLLYSGYLYVMNEKQAPMMVVMMIKMLISCMHVQQMALLQSLD